MLSNNYEHVSRTSETRAKPSPSLQSHTRTLPHVHRSICVTAVKAMTEFQGMQEILRSNIMIYK